MEGNQTRAVALPDVTHFAQHIGGVVHAGGRLHTQGVKLFGGREHLGHFGEARNDTAAVTKDTHGAALPVALAGFVRVLQLADEVGHVVAFFGQSFQTGDKAGPWTAFQLVKHGGVVLLNAH